MSVRLIRRVLLRNVASGTPCTTQVRAGLNARAIVTATGRTMKTMTRPDPQECAGSGWVASTPIEGVWTFTLSDTPEHALSKMDDAIIWRRILCYPIDNPISAVRYP